MILCCGEALIDMIPDRTVSGQASYVPCVGGAIFNTAVALGRLGAGVSLLSGVSHDSFGQMLTQALTDNKVGTDLLVRSDRLSTLAVVHLVNGSATYAFYDENSAGRMLDVQDFPPLPSEIEALYFGGISLMAEPGADAYAALLARERAGRVVMMDPNIRPDFISDPAAYRKRLDAMIAMSDIVKVSDEDLEWIVGAQDTLETQARGVLAKGPRFVIVTRGAEGAVIFDAQSKVEVPAERATAVDTVGAGDTFNAGVLARLAQDGQLTPAAIAGMTAQDMMPALQRGAQVAAVTVSRAGANPPWAAELDG
jgi:fructokinase